MMNVVGPREKRMRDAVNQGIDVFFKAGPALDPA